MGHFISVLVKPGGLGFLLCEKKKQGGIASPPKKAPSSHARTTANERVEFRVLSSESSSELNKQPVLNTTNHATKAESCLRMEISARFVPVVRFSSELLQLDLRETQIGYNKSVRPSRPLVRHPSVSRARPSRPLVCHPSGSRVRR